MDFQFRSGCPIASALDLVGDRWSLLIIRSMLMGARTYGELLDAPERIATNILADRLRRLTAAGLVRRTGRQGRAYELTPSGARLTPVVQALARWGEAEIPGRWPPPDRFYAARPQDFGG